MFTLRIQAIADKNIEQYKGISPGMPGLQRILFFHCAFCLFMFTGYRLDKEGYSYRML